MIIDIPSPFPKLHIYYSLWNILLVVFHRYTHKYVDLLLSCLVVVVLFTVCIHIYPKYLKIHFFGTKEKRIVDNKLLLIFLDITCHWIALLFIVTQYGKYYMKSSSTLSSAFTIFVLICYAISVNAREVYDVDWNHVFYASFGSIVIYFLVKNTFFST